MDKVVGNFDWGALCMPTLPWSTSVRKMPFFGRNDKTPLLISCVMGLQHAFAMIGGKGAGPHTHAAREETPTANNISRL